MGSDASGSVQAAGRRAAAAYLRELLLKPGAYRRSWEQYVLRARPGEVSQLAVAEVLSRHLWDYPRKPGDQEAGPQRLKDTVSRALSGRLLSRPTLQLFIDAFGFSPQETDRLWRLWNGSAAISVLAGNRAMPRQAERDVRAALGPRRHQTLSMHDHVFVGADGRLERTRTLQVIEAVAADLDRIPYLYDTSALTIEVGQGCQGLSGRLLQIGAGVYATDILLTKSLAIGETTTLEYWTSYRYPGDPADPQEREYRRAVMGHMENFDMRIEFHPGRLPACLWWASWDGLDGCIAQRQEVSLDRQHSAHRYLRAIERTVAGFYWTW